MDFKKESGRIYLEDENGKNIAQVIIPVKDGVLEIQSTVVDPSLRGQGVAAKFMLAVIELCKKENYKIKPTCSYAVNWFSKNTEYSDMISK